MATSGCVPVVDDFADVFHMCCLDYLNGMGVEFVIDLVPGIEPVSVAPYRMELVKLVVLKVQL